MEGKYLVSDVKTALAARSFPTVTVWNRLESRPRTENFDRALAAEVRDPLWMLAKQWQMGEFRGDDAGSPILAKLHTAVSRIDRYRAKDGSGEAFDDSVPLEAKVERRPVPLVAAGREIALDLRLSMGRHWLKLVQAVGDYRAEYIRQYPIHRPNPDQKQDADRAAHPEVWAAFAAMAGRAMDGAALYLHLKADSAHHAWDGVAVAVADRDAVDELGRRFVAWFEKLLYQPGVEDAWDERRFEYRFACSATIGGREQVLGADEYYHGHLDWYALDVDRDTPAIGGVSTEGEALAPITRTVIPTPVGFDGMPNTRWWAFEDGRTNFGDVKPDTTDLAKLLLVEFGLVFANDWFIVPLTLPVGVVAEVRGIAITNVFGERFWVEPAGAGRDEDWSRWAMFTHSTRGSADVPADTRLVLLPTVPKIQEGDPREEVWLVRDEVANMVWGIEKTVPLPTGEPKSGSEAATETLQFHIDWARRSGIPPASVAEPVAPLRYQVMNTVPENWIPFLPVKVDGNVREIQLQRGSMTRFVGLSGPPDRVKPRTSLLRHGLDQSPPQPYFVHEEEVPRAGARVTQSFQRTRWTNGRVFTWFGARKQTGRGEGSSGLAFDRLVDVGRPRA